MPKRTGPKDKSLTIKIIVDREEKSVWHVIFYQSNHPSQWPYHQIQNAKLKESPIFVANLMHIKDLCTFFFFMNKKNGYRGNLSWHLPFGCCHSDTLFAESRSSKNPDESCNFTSSPIEDIIEHKLRFLS